MFTTTTPEAQLLSMPSSAAIPPKLAPYPTDVGTAITGTPTRPGDHAWQGAFHAGHGNDDPGGLEPGALGDQTMKSRHANVIQPFDLVAHQPGRAGGLLGDRQVRRTGSHHQNPPFARSHILLTESDEGCIGLIRGLRQHTPNRLVCRLVRAGDEHGGPTSGDFGRDGCDLGRSFA